LNTAPQQFTLLDLGRQATAFYVDTLQRQYREGVHRSTPCPLDLVPVDFDRLNQYLPDQYHKLLPVLAALMESLDRQTNNILLIPNITLYTAIRRLSLQSGILSRLVDPITIGITRLKAGEIAHITLAGTRHTMNSDLLSRHFEEAGITVHRPEQGHIEQIDNIRLAVFASGYQLTLDRQLQDILGHYDNSVLACTELSILHRKWKNLPCYDLARLQIAEAVGRFTRCT